MIVSGMDPKPVESLIYLNATNESTFLGNHFRICNCKFIIEIIENMYKHKNKIFQKKKNLQSLIERTRAILSRKSHSVQVYYLNAMVDDGMVVRRCPPYRCGGVNLLLYKYLFSYFSPFPLSSPGRIEIFMFATEPIGLIIPIINNFFFL